MGNAGKGGKSSEDISSATKLRTHHQYQPLPSPELERTRLSLRHSTGESKLEQLHVNNLPTCDAWSNRDEEGLASMPEWEDGDGDDKDSARGEAARSRWGHEGGARRRELLNSVIPIQMSCGMMPRKLEVLVRMGCPLR
jgi:hypothetical protein